MQFKARWRSELDGWTGDRSKITSPEKIARGPLIVEHWRYRGASAPTRRVFEGCEELSTYLETEAFTGDAIHVWSWSHVCKSEQRLAESKCPAEDDTAGAHTDAKLHVERVNQG